MLRAIGMSFVMFWLGVIMWLGVECNTACSSVYSSECDIPIGAWILGGAFAIITFAMVITGWYDKHKDD